MHNINTKQNFPLRAFDSINNYLLAWFSFLSEHSCFCTLGPLPPPNFKPPRHPKNHSSRIQLFTGLRASAFTLWRDESSDRGRQTLCDLTYTWNLKRLNSEIQNKMGVARSWGVREMWTCWSKVTNFQL